MDMYTGVIVQQSLLDSSLIGKFKVLKTWSEGDWVLHKVQIEYEKISDIQKSLAPGPWYIHFWSGNNDDIIVIYKNAVFTIKASDKSTWDEAVSFGKSINTPSEQLF